MAKFFTTGYRKDRELTIFQTDGEKADLLRAICQNTSTGYVREAATGVLVPNHAVAKVSAHLRAMGWEG